MDYYCEIPWPQVWDEFDEWYGGDRWPSWYGTGGQQQKIQQILQKTIPWDLPWPKIWAALDEWCDENPKKWPAQKRHLQKLVQAAADLAVNEGSTGKKGE